jgi:hypothetical protein
MAMTATAVLHHGEKMREQRVYTGFRRRLKTNPVIAVWSFPGLHSPHRKSPLSSEAA